ncbi:MAG: hypothetical protein HYW33_01400 [Candidatus Blackburnbacteria bacterium]|nr:hypothetical protein [Candidatus Blackburnbacteria bacterium]
MKSLTIHNLDESTSTILEERSKELGTSLNKTIKSLIRESLGVTGNKNKESHFREFLGVWSKKEEEVFEKSTKNLRKVDVNDWA